MDHYTYVSLVAKAIDAIEKLRMQREAIEAEIMKQEQFIAATANFLPKEERELIVDRLKTIHVLHRVRQSGLTSAVRVVLSSTEAWMTAAQVRDRLMWGGNKFKPVGDLRLSSWDLQFGSLSRALFASLLVGTTNLSLPTRSADSLGLVFVHLRSDACCGTIICSDTDPPSSAGAEFAKSIS
jgi:hypothetical protein